MVSALHAGLAAWLEARGGYVSPKLDLAAPVPGSGGAERGVFATAAIRAGEQLLLLPAAAALNAGANGGGADGAPVLPAAAHLAAAHPALSNFLATSLLLMAEQARASRRGSLWKRGVLLALGVEGPWRTARRATAACASDAQMCRRRATRTPKIQRRAQAKGGASDYGPYLASLPPACGSLLYWSDAERGALAGSSLAGRGSRDVGELYSRHVAPILAGRPDLWPPASCGLDAFRHAAAMVQSRAFHLSAADGEAPAASGAAGASGAAAPPPDAAPAGAWLLPAVDMINHSAAEAARNTRLCRFGEALEVESNGRRFAFTGYFQMRAERDVPAGGQARAAPAAGRRRRCWPPPPPLLAALPADCGTVGG